MTQHSLITRLKAVEEALKNLHATVWRECPSLLNEDSGGNSGLDIGCISALSDLRELIKEAEGQAADVEQLIKLCSARPYPGSLSGQAWEDGCRQGYEWGTRLLGEKP